MREWMSEPWTILLYARVLFFKLAGAEKRRKKNKIEIKLMSGFCILPPPAEITYHGYNGIDQK